MDQQQVDRPLQKIAAVGMKIAREQKAAEAVGDLLVQGMLDSYAEDYELDQDGLAEVLEAAGYSDEDAWRLAARPWAVRK